jgi:hypothetical protein
MPVYDAASVPDAIGRGTLDPELESWLPSGPTLGADVPIAQGRRDHVQLGAGPWPQVGAVDTLVLPGPHGSVAVRRHSPSSPASSPMGGAEGNFELNAFRPILISNYLHSALIMADMCDHFREFMIEGTKLNQAKLKDNIDRSVMMVTALSPVIGYDQASVISYYAIDHDLTLKQAALANGVSEELFDRVVNPLALTRGGLADNSTGPGQP